MNIHPIFVHFPIALLTFYSIMEILQFRVFRNSRGWQLVKSVFVILGALGAVAAWITGEMAQDLVGTSPLIEKHNLFAIISLIFFAIMGLLYVARLINTEAPRAKDWLWNTNYVRTVWEILSRVSDAITRWWGILFILGLVGFALISITGALGGAIVYGPDTDPFARFVYQLLF